MATLDPDFASMKPHNNISSVIFEYNNISYPSVMYPILLGQWFIALFPVSEWENLHDHRA
jgi:hypothetical protein